jgi:hypothetical protein
MILVNGSSYRPKADIKFVRNIGLNVFNDWVKECKDEE